MELQKQWFQIKTRQTDTNVYKVILSLIQKNSDHSIFHDFHNCLSEK